jgi:hypothetical protein
MADPADELQQRLNNLSEINGDDAIESWHELGEAALALPVLPDGIANLHAGDIRPGIAGWDQAKAWAQANPDVEAAIKIGAERTFIGLPYGIDAVPESFQTGGFSVELPDLQNTISPTFGWLTHLERLAVWSKVEAWRRFESGEADAGIDLMVQDIGMLRKAADRGFLAEKHTAIKLMLDAIQSLREMLYLHLEEVSADRLRKIGRGELDMIRVDRDRLLLPELDRYVHQALVDESFDHRTGKVDEDAFRRRFTRLQGETSPVGYAGIDSRWRNLAEYQASLEASREQLDNLYDDWWRRWRVRNGTELATMILAEPPYAERLNAVRYAGILSTLGNMDDLFADRDRLVTELDATTIAAGIAAYRRLRGAYPRFARMAYGIDVPRHKDFDRFSTDNLPFVYFMPDQDWTLNVGTGQVVIPAGTGVLYSRGRDGIDNQGMRHSIDGYDGDLIIWPPPSVFELQAADGSS